MRELNLFARTSMHSKTAASTDLEIVIIVCIIIAVALINYKTVTLYPLVWLDEVMSLDPAVNLLSGRGFTSTAWYSVTFDNFWFGNTPLHSLLLTLWGKIFGLQLETERLFGHVISVFSVILIWISMRRLQIKSKTLKILFVLLFLTEYAVAFAYRSGRPDAICLLITAALLCSSTIEAAQVRKMALALSAFLVPWAGLQLMVALVFGGGVLWFASWCRRADVLAAGAGMVLGGLSLLAFYAANDSLFEFLKATIGSTHTLVGQAGALIVLGDEGLFGRLKPGALLETILQDHSQVILLTTICILAAFARSKDAYRSSIVALGIGLCFPLFMMVAGKYPLYYAWMGFVFMLAASLPLFEESMTDLRSASVAVIGIVAAIAVGLPLQLSVAIYQRDQRDYSAVREYVGRHVRPGEWVYVTSPAYFAALEHGAFVLSGTYGGSSRSWPGIPIDQQKRITTIISSPQEFPTVRNIVGGDWVATSGTLRTGHGEGRDPHHLDQAYYLQAYRKAK